MTYVYHKLLERTLKRLSLDPDQTPSKIDDWHELLNIISRVYFENDQDRYLLERSMEISSKELQERWHQTKMLEEQWRSLGECSPDLIIMVDIDNKIRFANKSKAPYTKQELIGKNVISLYPTNIQPILQKMLSETKLTKTKMTHDFQWPSENGEELWYTFRTGPILKEKVLTGFVIVETDVTEGHRVEQEIEARRKTQATAQVMPRSLANLSHEPGITHLLTGQGERNEILQKLTLIQDCGENILALTNNMLDFSKLEIGKIRIQNSSFDFRSCIQNIFDLFRPRAIEKNISIRYSIDESVPKWIIGDSIRIRQVLLNLVNNALKFTEKGEIIITASATQVTEENYEITISMKKIDVSGLGISINKGLIEAMGGKTGFVNQPGKVSDFFFSVVVKKAL
jgi:PAS domain S-box-containing protein